MFTFWKHLFNYETKQSNNPAVSVHLLSGNLRQGDLWGDKNGKRKDRQETQKRICNRGSHKISGEPDYSKSVKGRTIAEAKRKAREQIKIINDRAASGLQLNNEITIQWGTWRRRNDNFMEYENSVKPDAIGVLDDAEV